MKEKFKINKKVFLGLMTLLLVFCIIVVTSFIPFIIDPSKLKSMKFLTDELIIIAITIAVTIATMFVAQASNAENPKSELAKAKVEFVASLKEIGSRNNFYQWIKKVFQPKDKQEIIDRQMNKLGIDRCVYDLSKEEIESLLLPQKIGDKFYKKLTKEEINAVLSLKKKMAKYVFVSPTYYTSVSSMNSDKTLSEIAGGEGKKKISIIVFQLGTRILLTLIFGMIFASFVRDLGGGDGGGSSSRAQAWMTFFSRGFAFSSSSFLGFMVGSKLNDLDAYYINCRIEVHRLYKEDNTFVPVDEAKEQFKERVYQEGLLIEQKGD